MGREGFRIASVRARPTGPQVGGAELGVALLAASPRVALVGTGLCRADARGWELRGGEEALAGALRHAAEAGGFEEVRVGIADTTVAADAASGLAVSSPVIVPPGKDPAFLAPLPLAFLPLSPELGDTFRALGLRWIGEVAELERRELEARFGPEGLRAHDLACGDDDRIFRALAPSELPEARVELEGPVAELEPLLFVLRHLLARLCADLEIGGCRAARLELELCSDVTGAAPGRAVDPDMNADPVSLPIVPARPTAREDALFDLSRAVLERELARSNVGDRGAPPPSASGGLFAGPVTGPVAGLAIRVRETAPAEARQGDLFAPGWCDPLATAAALARLRARVGEEGVVRPAPRPDHRPEARSRWMPVDLAAETAEPGAKGGARADDSIPGPPDDPARESTPLPPALRLLPRPVPLEVRAERGRPTSLRDREGRRRVTAAEGPERLSGEWWGGTSYGREYWRLATTDGELLWVFRERRKGRVRWWLHGWWD